MTLTNTEQLVLEAINVRDLQATLAELIAYRSKEGNEILPQNYMAEYMNRIGMDVDVWKLDFKMLRKHPNFSMIYDRPEALGVVGVMGENVGGKSLILNGHIDTVPEGNVADWHYSPWEATPDKGRIYGRGAVDEKGGLACALHAVKAIHDSGVRIKGRVLIEPVVGEEDGGVGTLAAVLRGYNADGAVVLEPSELAIAPAQAGARAFRVTVPGLTAHGCVREEGVSAIEKFILIHQALMKLEKIRNKNIPALYSRYRLPYALNIGRIEAGDYYPNVPASLTFEGELRLAIKESPADACRQFEDVVTQTAMVDPWLRDHPPVVEWRGGWWSPAYIPEDHPLVGTLTNAFTDANDKSARVEGVPYGADMGTLVNVGKIPTVIFGPGDIRRAHRPDEYVPVDDLIMETRTLALAVLRYCGYKEV